jgi:hypothetical protein
MKKILFVISLMSLLIACQKEVSELQTHYFVKFYGDALDDTGSDIDLTANGGFVLAGTTTRSNGHTDMMLITTDKYGIQNSETVYYGGDGDEICTALLVLDDGYVLTGSSTLNDIENFVLVKFGLDGVQQWTTSWLSEGRGYDLAFINNQIVVSGYLNIVVQKLPMICTFDLQGNKLDLYKPTKNPGDYYTSVVNRNNKPFGFGTMFIGTSSTDMFTKGEATDIDTLTLSGNETSSKIISDSQGGFFIVGTTDPIGSGFSQIIVKKFNDINSFLSEDLTFNANPIGTDADFRGVDIQLLEDGSLAVLGDKTLSKDTDIILYILNPDGTTKSTKTYGKTGNQSASALKLTPDGGLIILGSNQQEKTNSMITLIKTDNVGNIWE